MKESFVCKIKILLQSASMKDHESVNSKSAEEIRLLTSFCIYYIFFVKWNISLIIMDIIICEAIYLRSVSHHRPNSYLSVSLCCNDNSTVHIIFLRTKDVNEIQNLKMKIECSATQPKTDCKMFLN